MTTLRPVPSGDDTPSEGAADSRSLAELLRESALGNEDAFATLYDETSARVYGLILRVVRDPAQAEEVTQETFLQVWRTASRYDEALGSALSWLMTLGHRRAVDRVRSAESTNRQDTAYHRRSHVIDHDSTAEAVEASMEARRVRAALKELTDTQRQALELAYLGGYTHSEVATMLNLPLGTAKTRIRDGLIRLRDTMGVGQ